MPTHAEMAAAAIGTFVGIKLGYLLYTYSAQGFFLFLAILGPMAVVGAIAGLLVYAVIRKHGNHAN